MAQRRRNAPLSGESFVQLLERLRGTALCGLRDYAHFALEHEDRCDLDTIAEAKRLLLLDHRNLSDGESR